MSTTILKKGQPGSRAWFRDSFVLHKLHSLSGVLPIGFFMIFHLVANSYSLRGEAEFNTAVKAIGYMPFVKIIEFAVIFIPLIFHSVYGFMITAEMRANVGVYQYGRNWLYLMQRISGIVAFLYICYHVYSTTITRWMYELSGQPGAHEAGFNAIAYAGMAYRFSSLLYTAVYLVGIAAASFHLANGLFNFCIRWGITIGKNAQRISAVTWSLVGIGLTFIGFWTAINFHQLSQNYTLPDGTSGVVLTERFNSLDDLVKFYGAETEPQNTTLEQPGSTPTSPEGNTAPGQ